MRLQNLTLDAIGVKCRRVFFILALLIGTSAPALSAEDYSDKLTNKQIADNFFKIAFGDEFGATDQSFDHIRKWTKKWRPYIMDIETESWQFSLLNDIVLDVVQMTGIQLDASVSDGKERDKNFAILFYDDIKTPISLFQSLISSKKTNQSTNEGAKNTIARLRRLQNSPETESYQQYAKYCHASTIHLLDGTFDLAVVYVPKTGPKQWLEACLYEEIIQVTGLTNDSYEVKPSIFNDDNEFLAPTKQDRIFVQLLYDRRVLPGMSHDEAYPIIRQILSEIRPEGEP